MATQGSENSSIVVVRHGQTEWSRDGRHTGRTDIPLTAQGMAEAQLVAPTLADWDFAHVFSSPLSRARDTAAASGLDASVVVDDDLLEWDYGIFEGRTTVDIQAERPGWNKWLEPIEGGEDVDDVGRRADRAIERLAAAAADGPVLVFAHGHLLAVLIARWLGLPALEGRRFILETATASVLSTKRDDRVLRLLNHRCGASSIAPD